MYRCHAQLVAPLTTWRRPLAWTLLAWASIPWAAVLAIVCCPVTVWAEEARGAIDAEYFVEHVQPILEANCTYCHGADTQKSALNLSTAASILRGGESGSIFDAEDPHNGTLYKYVEERVMPPAGEGELAEEDIETLKRWIEAGAPMDAQPVAEKPMTEHDALPTLLLRCAVCHGRQRQEGGLDIRSVASLLKGGKSGPAIVPGKSGESLLLKRIHAREMPPRETLAFYSVRPVTDSELENLAKWIDAGAPRGDVRPDIATTEPDPLVTDEDRQFWSFQPPRAADPPRVKAESRVSNPVDAFVLAKLEENRLTFSPEADRRVLARRAYYDLTGLPPMPQEVEAFVADRRPNAYELLVERALASPHYGERWGQYWLDVAGYSDSEGIQNADDVRPHAWRYRDYVIRAFNADKPYDRFLMEQLAGDELADYESVEKITPEIYDNLVATAFLRLTADATYAPITGFVSDRLEVIDDEIEVFSSAVLGLTIKCARCHSHKFDPIPQRDYYRLAAAFKGALDENDWVPPRTGGPDQPKDDVPALLPYGTPEEMEAWQAAGAKPEEVPHIRAVWDRGEPSPTYVLRRGNYLTPGTLVGPGVPAVLTDGRTPFEVSRPWPGAKKTGRRLALAKWVTQKDHPLTARVMVNRIWKHHFGEGLVKSLDNFGKTGAPPTHPELLDWLAVYFTDHDWSIKEMHRLLMNSSTYRQTSQVTPEQLQLDPDGTLLSRMPLKRMEGEVLRDSLLLVAGKLDDRQFGKADGLSATAEGLVTVKPGSDGRWRRSIYALKRRTQPVTILQNFDVAGMDPNCVERRESIVAPQALHLQNDSLVRDLARAFSDRIWQHAGKDPKQQVIAAYRLATGRPPTERETEVALAGLDQLRAEWLQSGVGTRHELAAKTHLWIRESEPEVVYENDLISVWSKSSTDGARRIGVVEFDVSELADVSIADACLELGQIDPGTIRQSAAVIPPAIEGLNWARFEVEKRAHARTLGQLGRIDLSAEGGKSGTYVRSQLATPDDLQVVQNAARSGGRLALLLIAEEDGQVYRQDWDDGVHPTSRGHVPRLVVHDTRSDEEVASRKALENLCHALFNSAAFLYID